MIRTRKWFCVKVSGLTKLAVQNYIKHAVKKKHTLILYSVNPHFLCNISTKGPNFHIPSEEEEEAEEPSQSNLPTAGNCRLPSPQPIS